MLIFVFIYVCMNYMRKRRGNAGLNSCRLRKREGVQDKAYGRAASQGILDLGITTSLGQQERCCVFRGVIVCGGVLDWGSTHLTVRIRCYTSRKFKYTSPISILLSLLFSRRILRFFLFIVIRISYKIIYLIAL